VQLRPRVGVAQRSVGAAEEVDGDGECDERQQAGPDDGWQVTAAGDDLGDDGCTTPAIASTPTPPNQAPRCSPARVSRPTWAPATRPSIATNGTSCIHCDTSPGQPWNSTLPTPSSTDKSASSRATGTSRWRRTASATSNPTAT
jgi:hypothetical protein